MVILLQAMSLDFLLLTIPKTILLLFEGLSRIVNLEISVSNVSYSNSILGVVKRGSQSIYYLSIIIPKLINTIFHLLHFFFISLRSIPHSSCSSLIFCSASLTLFVLIHILFLPFIQKILWQATVTFSSTFYLYRPFITFSHLKL